MWNVIFKVVSRATWKAPSNIEHVVTYSWHVKNVNNLWCHQQPSLPPSQFHSFSFASPIRYAQWQWKSLEVKSIARKLSSCRPTGFAVGAVKLLPDCFMIYSFQERESLGARTLESLCTPSYRLGLGRAEESSFLLQKNPSVISPSVEKHAASSSTLHVSSGISSPSLGAGKWSANGDEDVRSRVGADWFLSPPLSSSSLPLDATFLILLFDFLCHRVPLFGTRLPIKWANITQFSTSKTY